MISFNVETIEVYTGNISGKEAFITAYAMHLSPHLKMEATWKEHQARLTPV